MSVILALRRLKQEDPQAFEASLGHRVQGQPELHSEITSQKTKQNNIYIYRERERARRQRERKIHI